MRVVITDKLSLAEKLIPELRSHWNGATFYIVCTHPGEHYVTKFPRARAYSRYPFVAEPEYAPTKKFFDCIEVGKNLSNRERLSPVKALDVIKKASELFHIHEKDYEALHGSKIVLDFLHEFWTSKWNARKSRILWIEADNISKSLSLSIKNPVDLDDPEYNELLKAARIKEYFDYNFKMNSRVILGNLYRKVSGTTDPVFIDQYMLQFLFRVDAPPVLLANQVDAEMRDWKGTGKYDLSKLTYIHGFGSESDRYNIIRNLSRLGLIVFEPNFCLSEMGEDFMDHIHKRTRDPDLPFRIDDWMKRPWFRGRRAILEYMESFFGQQKKNQGC